MSTILDALRRLQRDRSHDLHESVALDPGPASGGDRYVPWLAGLVLLLALAGGAAAWTIWPGAQAFQESWRALFEPERAPDAAAVEVATSTTTAPAPSVATVPEREAPAGLGVRPPSLTPEALAERRAAARERAKERAERVARGRVSRPPREPDPVANASPSPGPAEQLAARQALDPAFLNAPSPKPAPPLDFGFELEPLPPPRDRDRDRAEPHDLIASQTAAGFPDLSVQRVRWHPQPERREALILLDEMRPIDAREGDIISGVVVHRIDPGSVEFRLGDVGFVIGP